MVLTCPLARPAGAMYHLRAPQRASYVGSLSAKFGAPAVSGVEIAQQPSVYCTRLRLSNSPHPLSIRQNGEESFHSHSLSVRMGRGLEGGVINWWLTESATYGTFERERTTWVAFPPCHLRRRRSIVNEAPDPLPPESAAGGVAASVNLRDALLRLPARAISWRGML